MANPVVPLVPDEVELDAERRRVEILRGEELPVSPTGFEHGVVVLAFGGLLRATALRSGVGEVVTEVGFRLAEDVLLAPDLALVAADAVPKGSMRRRMIRGAPRLAVEIVSPGQDAGELAEKIESYLSAGAEAVWVLDPSRAAVAVHEPGQPVRLLRHEDSLAAGEMIPGFAMPVADVFALVETV